MAPLPFDIDSILPRSLHTTTSPSEASTTNLFPRTDSAVSPVESHDFSTSTSSLFRRDDDDGGSSTAKLPPGDGSSDPTSFNNQGFMALFAILGAAMVIASIWFFFWAKNGGFHFQEGDWDDYKSTVLRRKGPDGRTLSNATKSTKLGGGTSIAGTQHFKWAQQAAKTVVSRDEKGRKGILAKRGWGGTHSVMYSDDYMTETFGTQTVSDEMTEVRTDADPEDHHKHSKRYRDRDVHDYKRERPARVGGMNRVADGSSYMDGSVTERSELMSDTSSQPILGPGTSTTTTPKKSSKEKEQARAERRARDEAAKMERRWKKEAEEAAAALARENATSSRPPKYSSAIPTPPTHAHAPSASPSKPAPAKRRAGSPAKKSEPARPRDFSYSGAGSEVLSTAYTGATSQTGSSGVRSGSYYDSYRPKADAGGQQTGGYAAMYSKGRRESEVGGKKKTRAGGYRRGADSDLE